MKRFITICIGSSLMLTAAAMAQQQDDAQATPTKKQQQHARQQARKQRQGTGDQGAEAAQPASPAHAGMRARNAHANGNAAAEANANANVNAKPDANTQAERRNQRRANRKAAQANQPATAAPDQAKAQSKNAQAKSAQEKAPAAAQANQPNQNKPKAKAKKPDVQVVQKIKAQHANFHAAAKPQQVPAVTFNESHRIQGAEHWQGERYAAFRSYHPQRHDRGWYHNHYHRIELIGGGYYYWNSGYWYPAWGYDPAASYYVYDGPIYTGQVAEPPDRVIADVQATLQEMGYYKGEVDGLLGPLTREALTAYQSDNGLYTTAAIDEPTLQSLGMAG